MSRNRSASDFPTFSHRLSHQQPVTEFNTNVRWAIKTAVQGNWTNIWFWSRPSSGEVDPMQTNMYLHLAGCAQNNASAAAASVYPDMTITVMEPMV